MPLAIAALYAGILAFIAFLQPMSAGGDPTSASRSVTTVTRRRSSPTAGHEFHGARAVRADPNRHC